MVGSPYMTEAEEPTTPSPTRVLLVDDDPVVAGELAAYLRAHGFEVLTAGDGAAAIALAPAEPLDIVVVDLLLPGASGFQVAQAVRAAKGPDVRILMTSELTAVEHREYALLLGVDWFLAKPFAPPELLAVLHSLLLIH
jgi:DNA-binding response OmpR family regulator